MIKLYKTNREVQLQWMRDNPGKTIALNVVLAVGVFVAIMAYDQWQEKKWKQEIAEQD